MCILRLFLISLLLCAPVMAQASGSMDTERALNSRIESIADALQEPEPDKQLYFEMGTLYWAKRDHARHAHGRNELARKASRYFSKYASFDELGARKAIALFCIDRIRQSQEIGISPSDDFIACSTMVSRYISRDGRMRQDDNMDIIIREAMANEVLYDISYRFIGWEYDELRRLGNALKGSTLVSVTEPLFNEALITNLESRLGLNYIHKTQPTEAGTFRESFVVADSLAMSNLSPANQKKLEGVFQRAFTHAGLDAGLGRELIVAAWQSLGEAKAAVIVYHISTQRLPLALSDTAYNSETAVQYFDKVSYSDKVLALSFADHFMVPPDLRKRSYSRGLSIDKGVVMDDCEHTAAIPLRYELNLCTSR